MRRIHTLLPAALLAATLAAPALAQGGLLNRVRGAARGAAVGSFAMSLEKEREIGREVAAVVAGRWGVVNDPALNDYVNLVGTVVAQFDAAGALKQPGAGRIVQRAADRKVARVIVRTPAVQSDFPESLLAMSRGRRTLTDLVQRGTGRVADNRSQSLALTAGARGVNRTVDTPGGRITVTSDDAAVRAMDARTVDAVAVDAFIRGGRLEQTAPVKEETTP